jgi:ribonuclease HI
LILGCQHLFYSLHTSLEEESLNILSLNLSNKPAEAIVYTAGSAVNHPSRGGYAAVIMQGCRQERSSGGFRRTIRMELMAAVVALERLSTPCKVTLLTDCKPLQQTVEGNYFRTWDRRGWINIHNSPVVHGDLWRRLRSCLECHEVRLVCIASASVSAEKLLVAWGRFSGRYTNRTSPIPTEPHTSLRLRRWEWLG